MTRNLDFADKNSYASGVINLAYRPLNNANPTAPEATEVAPASGLNVGWVPIGSLAKPFEGTFEGNGFEIRNLYSNTTSSTGLFGYVEDRGIVQNIGVIDAYVEGNGLRVDVGALVGRNNGGVVQNAYASGNAVFKGDGSVGGLIGANDGTIRNVYAHTKVVGTGVGMSLGGLVGINHKNQMITNVYATGTVTGGSNSEIVGGLVGHNNGEITNAYATGFVSMGGRKSGGLVAVTIGGTVTAGFWNTETTRQSTSVGGVAQTTTQLQALTAATSSWDNNNWKFGNSNQYPILKRYVVNQAGEQAEGDILSNQIAEQVIDPVDNSVVEIASIEDLNDLRHNLAGNYVLIKNLDFANANSYFGRAVNNTYRPQNTTNPSRLGDPATATNPGFVPIGTATEPFTGTFDGNGFEIHNLYINASLNAGLFGTVYEDAFVQNIKLVNAYVKGSGDNLGTDALIENYDESNLGIGLLIGNNSGIVQNISTDGSASLISNSNFVGGVVGFNAETGLVRNTYTSATITGTGDLVSLGNLVGVNSGIVQNAYATGSVSGTGTKTHFGGLVGTHHGIVRYAYAVGKVQGGIEGGIEEFVGGLAGRNISGTFTACYYDNTPSGTAQTSSLGRIPFEILDIIGTNAAGLKALTATNSTWNTNNWEFGNNNQYPALRSYAADPDYPILQVQGNIFCQQPKPRVLCLAEDPDQDGFIEISTIEDLNSIRYRLKENYLLTQNLDFAKASSYATNELNIKFRPQINSNTEAVTLAEINAAVNSGFRPIGEYSRHFEGVFEGNGFTISNLYINELSGRSPGLFKTLGTNGFVQNVGLVNAYVKGSGENVSIGSLVATNNGTVQNVYASGFVTLTSGSGICGVGGLVGTNDGGVVQHAFTTTSVVGAKAIAPRSGLAVNEISAGGLVGINSQGSIYNAYTTGITIGGGDSERVGGIVGFNTVAFIQNTYAIGRVRGGSDAKRAALVGEDINARISSSFWNKNVTSAGIGSSSSSSNIAAVGKTSVELNALTAANSTWSANHWDFGNNNQYPALRSYQVDDTKTAEIGDVICGQPLPRAQGACPLLAFTATAPLTAAINGNNTYDFGEVLFNTEVTFSYEITGELLSTELLVITLVNGAGVFSFTPTADITPTAGGGLPGNTVITVAFHPTSPGNYAATIVHSGAGLIMPLVLSIRGLGTAPGVPYLQLQATPPSQLTGNIFDFGPLLINNQTSDLSYTLTGGNLSGDVSLAIAGEDPAAFTIVSPLEAIKPTNGMLAQAIVIKFTPTTATAHTATITHNSPGLAESIVLNVKGLGTAPGVPYLQLQTTPPSQLTGNIFDFGPLLINNQTSDLSYTLTGGNLSGDVSLAIAGEDPAAFTIVSPLEAIKPTNGALAQAIVIKFTPTTATAHTATITHSSPGLAKPIVLNIKGLGTAPGVPYLQLQATPSSQLTGNTLDFGSLLINNQTGNLSYMLTGGNLSGDVSLAIAGEDPAAFTIVSPLEAIKPTNGALAQAIVIKFTPATATAHTATITHSSPGLAKPIVLNIKGLGTAPTVPYLQIQTTPPSQLTENTLDFGSLLINDQTGNLSYMLTGGNLSGDVSLVIAGEDAAAFTIVSPVGTIKPTNGMLAQAIIIKFTPATATAHTAAITHSSPGLAKPIVLNIKGLGTAPTVPYLQIQATSSSQLAGNTLDFGSLLINNQTGNLSYMLTGGNLSGSISLAIAGAHAAAFTIVSPAEKTLKPKDGTLTQNIVVKFNPINAVAHTATISHSGPGLGKPIVLTVKGLGEEKTAPTVVDPNMSQLLGVVGSNGSVSDVHLSPNPIADRLFIQGVGSLQVIIYNILGVELLSTQLFESGEIDCSALIAGLYIIQVQTSRTMYTQRILKY